MSSKWTLGANHAECHPYVDVRTPRCVLRKARKPVDLKMVYNATLSAT